MAPAKESNPLPRAGLSVGKPNRLSLDNITRLLPGCFFFLYLNNLHFVNHLKLMRVLPICMKMTFKTNRAYGASK